MIIVTIDKLCSQIERKSKTCFFFTFSYVYVSWIEWDRILILQLTPINVRYFSKQNGQKQETMNVNVVNFQIQKLISQRFRAQKVDDKIGSFV